MTRADSERVTLRPATPADLPFLLALREQTMTAHERAVGVVPGAEQRQSRVLHRFECAQIIEHAGAAVGLFKVARDGLDWQLVQIQLSPELQGRGIGAELITHLIEEARRAGASLTLFVFHHNPARHLYERIGFRIVGDSDHQYEMRLGGSARAAWVVRV